MRQGSQCTAMVATEIAAAFVVIESQLACELPVVKLDGPAQPRKPGDTFKWFVFGGGWRASNRRTRALLRAIRAMSHSGAWGFMASPDGMGRHQPKKGEATPRSFHLRVSFVRVVAGGGSGASLPGQERTPGPDRLGERAVVRAPPCRWAGRNPFQVRRPWSYRARQEGG